MPYSGPCPRCHEELFFPDLPRPGERCCHCDTPFLAIGSEHDPGADVVPIELVEYEAGDTDRDPWETARTVRQLVPVGAAWLLSACLGIVALTVLGLGLVLLSAENAPAGMVIGVLGFGVVLAFGVAFVGRQVLRQPGDTVGFRRFRSIFSVLAGGVTLFASILFTWFAWRWIPGAAKAGALGIPIGILFYFGPSAVAGWVVARLAPAAPVRHAVALGLLLPLGIFLMTLGGDVHATVLAPVLLILCLPGLVIGAWFGRRRSERSAGGR